MSKSRRILIALALGSLFLLSCDLLGLGRMDLKPTNSVPVYSCGYMRMMDDTLIFVVGDARIYDFAFGILNTARPDSAYWMIYHSGAFCPQDAVFRDGIGYLALENMVQAVDFTDLAHYRMLDNVPVNGVYVRLALDGYRLLVVTEDSFSVVDVSNPAEMVVLSRYGYQRDSLRIYHQIYCAAADRGRLAIGYGSVSGPEIYLYGTETPTAPAPLHVISLARSLWGRPNWLEFKDDWLIYGNSYGLFALHLEHERQWMIRKDSIDIWFAGHVGERLPGEPYAGVKSFDINGPYAACACAEQPWLAVVDVSDPSELKLAYPLEGDTGVLEWVDATVSRGHYLYAALGNKSIATYALP